MNELIQKGELAKTAAAQLSCISTRVKNTALAAMAQALADNCGYILEQNAIDTASAAQNGISKAMLDRLTLTKERIRSMADGILEVAALPDPVGETAEGTVRPNGLEIVKKRVPIGVIGIIYEARPNVTSDAAALCIKSGNAAFLRGGSEAINSNKAIVSVMTKAAIENGLPKGCIVLVENTSRELASEMMRLNGYIDVLIPRGGAGLIKSVVKNSTVPVIETGAGVCHTYVSAKADFDMAVKIAVNAKASRPSVCNAMETLLIQKSALSEFLPMVKRAMEEKNVELRGCGECLKVCPDMKAAAEDDWSTEYGDYILSVKAVEDLNDAVGHIARYGTGHSEAIITRDYSEASEFTKRVDAAAVYVNASTRFTDGNEFGLGAEIGISTQKIHARGPMGLKELTIFKYIVTGNGQVRE